MSRRPLTYAVIEDELRDTMARAERLTEEFAASVSEKSEAEAAYKVGIAKARLRFRYENEGKKVTDQTTSDHATADTENEFKAYLIAEARYEALKQALYTARDRGDQIRSLMASYRDVAG